jgi:diadenosine tetraphosphate (Ap4A) HIT family hydrolase
MSNTIFDEIIEGSRDSYKIWEDDKHLAFLTPFPNTPGFTVLIPKQNFGDYVFSLSDEQYVDMMIACKKVAKILEKALNTPRVALIYEGTGVAYVHAKLIPLHGELAGKTDVWSNHTEFNEEYLGWLTTAEGPEMSKDRLVDIQNKIIEASKVYGD